MVSLVELTGQSLHEHSDVLTDDGLRRGNLPLPVVELTNCFY
jgi:hypothetical protein